MITKRLRVLLHHLHGKRSATSGVTQSINKLMIQIIQLNRAPVTNADMSQSALGFDSFCRRESKIVPKDALIGYAYEDKKSL